MPYQKGKKTIHRLVVLPEFQGLGIGTIFLNEITKQYITKEWDVHIQTSNTALIYSLNKNKHWKKISTKMNTPMLREREYLRKYNISEKDKRAYSGTNLDNALTRYITSFKTNKKIW